MLHSCLLTSFKAKKKRNVKNLLMKLFATFLRMYEMMGSKQCHVVSRKENSWLNAARVPLAKTVYSVHIKCNFLSQTKCIDWVYSFKISLIIGWRCLRRHCFKYHKTIYTLKSSLNNQLLPFKDSFTAIWKGLIICVHSQQINQNNHPLFRYSLKYSLKFSTYLFDTVNFQSCARYP